LCSLKFKYKRRENIKKKADPYDRCRLIGLVLTCSDSHVIDVVVGHDFPLILLGVVDTSIQNVLYSTDVSEGVTRTWVRHFSIALQLFPFQIFRLYKTKAAVKKTISS